MYLPGWKSIKQEISQEELPAKATDEWDVPTGILGMLFGCVAVFSALFAVGKFLYSDYSVALILSLISAITTVVVIKLWSKLKTN